MINHYYEKVKQMKQRFSTKKCFIKKLVQSLKEKILRLNLIMSKLLILSKCLQLNCLQIKQLFGIASLYFELAEHFTFHISHTTSGIIL